jgi:hypothetical protein
VTRQPIAVPKHQKQWLTTIPAQSDGAMNYTIWYWKVTEEFISKQLLPLLSDGQVSLHRNELAKLAADRRGGRFLSRRHAQAFQALIDLDEPALQALAGNLRESIDTELQRKGVEQFAYAKNSEGEEWGAFREDVAARLLEIFDENGIKLKLNEPPGEEIWRALAIRLAIKSGDLPIQIKGQLLPVAPTLAEVDARKAVSDHPDYRRQLDSDAERDSLFRFFLRALANELANYRVQQSTAAPTKVYRREASEAYESEKSQLQKQYGRAMAQHLLLLKAPERVESDMLASARKVLGILDYVPSKRGVGKSQAARLAYAELSLRYPHLKLTKRDILSQATSFQVNHGRSALSDDQPHHPRYKFIAFAETVYAVLENVASSLVRHEAVDPPAR